MQIEENLWETLLEESVGHVLASKDFDSLVEMLNTSPILDPLFADVPEGGRAAFAHAFGREVWNATPLPGNRFRPRYRLPPESGRPCPCGSGLKYKRCCELAPRHPPFATALIWSIAWPMFDETEKDSALKAGAIPPEALPVVAREQLDEGHPGNARDLLEPLFESPGKAPNNALVAGVELLSEAYRDLGHDKKRREFLERLADTTRGPVLVEVAGELCPILADGGDWEEAWRRYGQAMRAVPDDPMLAMLEVTMLYAQKRADEGGSRAEFWRRRLGSRLEPGHPVREALERLASNPEGGLAAMGGDDVLLRVRQVIGEGLKRPQVAHLLIREEAGTDDADFEAVIRQHFRGMGIAGDDLEQAVSQAVRDLDRDSGPMGDDNADDEVENGEDVEDSAWLKAPPAIAETEAQWAEIFPGTKPFSISFEPFGDADPWAPDDCAQWLDFLEKNPGAFDSLEILDDLATALYIHPATVAGILDELFADVVQRGVGLLDRTLTEHGETVPQLHWPMVANRPALRLLAHHIHLLDSAERIDEAMHRMEQYLLVSPGDNHGFRTRLVDLYLQRGDDEAALELSERFPDDILIETTMGRVLALYRLGRLEEAAAQLKSTHGNNPHLVEMLVKSRVKKQKIDERGIRPGGPDQAWLYRESMRPVWQATPGAMDWLKERARMLE